MDSAFFLREPPPLDPAWLAHEQASNLLAPKPIITDPLERQIRYSEACRALNTSILSGRDKHLNHGLSIQDFLIQSPDGNHSIPIRRYTSTQPTETQEDDKQNVVIYYHGGGLCVGDLDSEDLSCRRVAKSLSCTLYSVAYRLMPQHTPDDSLADAIVAFNHLSKLPHSKIVLIGSSSGGQLAAQVSQLSLPNKHAQIHGVLLRCPVTSEPGNTPERWRSVHNSMNEKWYTSLLSGGVQNRTREKLPLEEEGLEGLPRHWVQVCTNDVFWSDGVCYVEGLRERGVEVRVDVVKGWPHTFWLKAPGLEAAREAEQRMVDGLRWLFDN